MNRYRFAFLVIQFLGFLLINPSNLLKAQSKKLDRPNILLFVFDDASYAHFSANGCKWINTPGYDLVAKEGILFKNFYTPNAKCAPSRASMLTGLYPWQLKEAGNHISRFPTKIKVFTETLKENGYTIGHTGKPWGPGTAKTADGKNRELTGTPYQKRLTTAPTAAISKTDYTANFSDFLNDAGKAKPWFFWCGGWEPHRPYAYKSGINYGKKTTAMIDRVPAYLPDNDTVRTDLLDYAYEIEYFDNHILKMINNLKKKGMLDNTIIIITSDNGMPFPRSKGDSFEISNHIPMVMMWKKGIKNPGKIVADYFSMVDLAPTFLAVSNINPIASSGKSLQPIFNDINTGNHKLSKGVLYFGRERNDFGRPHNQGYPTRSIMKDGFLYIYNFKPDRYPGGNPETGYLDVDGSPSKTAILNLKRSGSNSWFWDQSFALRPEEELYNLSKDIDCMRNLAKNKNYTSLKSALKNQLFNKLKSQKDPRVMGKGDVFDNYPFMTNDYWNFWERVKNKEILQPYLKTPWVEPTDYEN